MAGYCEMLFCDVTSWGTNLRSKLCGCWMCFRKFPWRLAMRNLLCRRKQEENAFLPVFVRYRVQGWTASLPPHLTISVQTTISDMLKHRNKIYIRYSAPRWVTFIFACSLCFPKACLHQVLFLESSTQKTSLYTKLQLFLSSCGLLLFKCKYYWSNH